MHIFIGSDHGGFQQKQFLLKELQAKGFGVTDVGGYSGETEDDYPDFAGTVAQAVTANPADKGILLCRSGEGMEMAANKIPHIRAAVVWNTKVAQETRRDNDANVLVLPSDFISNQEALDIAEAFLTTQFSEEPRHIRRLEKLHALEHTHYEG